MLAVSHLNKSEMTSPNAVIRVALKAGIVPALTVDHIQHEAGFGVRNGVPVAVNAVEDLILCSSPVLLPELDAGAGLQDPGDPVRRKAAVTGGDDDIGAFLIFFPDGGKLGESICQ